MALYTCRCPQHGAFDTFLPAETMVQAGAGLCPICGDWSPRVYTPAVTDCQSFGRDNFVNRKPAWKQRPRDEREAATMRDLRIANGAGTVFGQVPGRRGG